MLLTWQLAVEVPAAAAGGVGALLALPPAELVLLAPQLASAFRVTYGLALALMVVAGVVAAVVLRRPPGSTGAAGEFRPPRRSVQVHAPVREPKS